MPDMGRRGIDRITLRQLRAGLRAAEAAWTRHTRSCHRCHIAGNETARYCHEGWEDIKALTLAASRLRRYM
jgi:hypothetical protein